MTVVQSTQTNTLRVLVCIARVQKLLVAASAAAAIFFYTDIYAIGKYTICSIFISNFIDFSFATVIIIEHRTFNLLFSCICLKRKLMWYVCVCACAVLYASLCLSHLITVCYQHIQYGMCFICIQFDFMPYIRCTYALIPLFSSISHLCVCVYGSTFNKSIYSNHSNWARYTQPFFFFLIISISHCGFFFFVCL